MTEGLEFEIFDIFSFDRQSLKSPCGWLEWCFERMGLRPEYEDCTLRCVTTDLHDAELLFKWRNSHRVRINMFCDGPISMKEHMAWFHSLAESSSYRLWIFEYKKRPLGQVNIKAIDTMHNRCTWGFYIGEENAPSGMGSAMLYLAMQEIFDRQRIRKLCSEILAFNHISIHLHEKFGFRQEGLLNAHILRNAEYVDVVLMALLNADWQGSKDRLRQLIFANGVQDV